MGLKDDWCRWIHIAIAFTHWCILRSTLACCIIANIFFAHLERNKLLRKTDQCERGLR